MRHTSFFFSFIKFCPNQKRSSTKEEKGVKMKGGKKHLNSELNIRIFVVVRMISSVDLLYQNIQLLL